jgi:hypothetical protein
MLKKYQTLVIILLFVSGAMAQQKKTKHPGDLGRRHRNLEYQS